jgi:thioredoxin reductase
MEASLAAFAERTGLAVRYGCRWESTRRLDDGRFELTTSDGVYSAGTLVFAVGVAEPWRPEAPGMDLTAHYAETRPVETYADKRIFIIGKQNSGFELASGFLPWAKRILIASPSPAKLSVQTHSLVGIRARYVQPYEDHVLGGGVAVLDASIQSIERTADGTALVVRTRRSDDASEMAFEVDEVIAATGFVTPLRDLPALGVATFGQSRLPAQTPFWESATAPGVFFAGTIGQGAKGLLKHGIPANSGAVQGARYNARVLARHVARTRFGIEPERPSIAAARLGDFVAGELTRGPEIWHQRAYLARVVTLDPTAGILDEGIGPLADFVDAGGPDALAITLEMDGSGDVYPVLYTRTAGRVAEHRIDAHPLLDYETPAARTAIAAILHGVDAALA